RNESKKRKHVKLFTKAFVDDCEICLSQELMRITQANEEHIKNYNRLSRELEQIKRKTREVYLTFQESVEQFLEETTEDVYQYIHSREFKSLVLDGIEKYSRFTIGKELDARIEKVTFYRQQEKIVAFEKNTLQNIAENIVKIQQSLHNIVDKMTGLKSPFDVEDKLGSVLVSLMAPSSTAIAGGLAMMYMSASPKAAQAVAAAGVVTGLVFTGLIALDVFDDYETVIKNAYQARIDKVTTTRIRQSLKTDFTDKFIKVIKNVLEEDFKRDFNPPSATVNSLKREINSYTKAEKGLLSMRLAISKIRSRLEEIKRLEINFE
ncbi:uncharacterized protein LOC134272802, partial [Saccostrea cucullata]|uniref:uncharacterized protein LOC134272802 n=1 Tax=Saccostrea cuccullata TaxID=36930 RepID=UPI002ED68ACD